MTPETAQALLQLAAGFADVRQFYTTYQIEPAALAEAIQTFMRQCILERNPDRLDTALELARRHLWPQAPELEQALYRELIPLDWHCHHEEMISDLQQHPDARNVEVLRQAIALKPELDYLDYDDYGSYYKKCLWALQVIASPAAIDVIRQCAAGVDPVLQQAARYRLRRMGLESG